MPGYGTVADGTVVGMAAGGGVPAGTVVGMAPDGDRPAGVGGLAGAAGDGAAESALPLAHVAAGPTDLAGCPAAGLIAKRPALARDCCPNHASRTRTGIATTAKSEARQGAMSLSLDVATSA